MMFPSTYQPVLVTGATGFMGSNLVRRLVALGCRPHVLVHPESAWWRLTDLRGELHVHVADLSEAERLREIIAEVRPQTIYHLATYGAYPRQQTDVERVLRTDVLGTWHLLRACLEVDFRLLVNTGTSSEYGRKTRPMSEEDSLDPTSEYGVAKVAQTMLCRHIARTTGRPIVTIRPFSVYGPFEEPIRLFPTLISRCLSGRPLQMVGAALTRDFVYVDDAIGAYLLVDRLSAHGGEVFNIGTGVPSSMRDTVEAVMRATQATVPVEWGGFAARSGDPECWVGDCSKANRLLGWSSRVGLEEGVRRMVDWFKAYYGAPGSDAQAVLASGRARA